MPDARLAWFRTFVYAFVILDIHTFVNDPIPLSHSPELYHPLVLAKLAHLPPPSVPLAWALYVVIVAGSLLAAFNRLPRAAGLIVAAAFTWWVLIGFSYGKVDHDHMALVLTLWLLPTAGPITIRWRAVTTSDRSGWVLKCAQIAVIGTYFLSALNKIHNGGAAGWDGWPNSLILMWAIVRRPHGLGQFLVPYPQLLHAMQWAVFIAELSSVVILWLRGRPLLLAALFWMGFHVFTLAVLYIHFAPTLICWLAFAPLERLTPWLDRRRAKRLENVTTPATG